MAVEAHQVQASREARTYCALYHFPSIINKIYRTAQASREARAHTFGRVALCSKTQASREARAELYFLHCPSVIAIVLSFITTLKLALANDIETNPGPTKYPCGICSKKVGWNRPAIACDNCNFWFHKDCIPMPSIIYNTLANTSISWICCNCGMPSFTNSFFDTTPASSENPYDPLASDNSFDQDQPSPQMGPPLLQSSPKQTRSGSTPINTQSLKVIVVNIQSVLAKKVEWLELLSSSNPDIILGCETWLKPEILDSEIVPPEYKLFRHDRKDGYGGTLIAMRQSYIAEELPSSNSSLELTCVKINLIRNHPLIVCCAYRPPNRNVEYQENLCKEIHTIAMNNKDSALWIAGDLNLPDIKWSTESIHGNRYPTKINQLMLDVTQDLTMEQVVKFPTRKENILDVFLTNRSSLITKCEPIPGISDHDTAIYIETSIAASRTKPPRRTIYLWKRGNYEEIKQELDIFSTFYFSQFNLDTPVNQLWSSIKSKIEELIKNHIPSKPASSRHNQPWINRDIIKLSRKKARYFTRAKTSNSQEDWSNYKIIKKSLRKVCRLAHTNYIKNIIGASDDDNQKPTTKKFWKYVKSLRRDNTGTSSLKKDGIAYSDASSKANILNDQFSSVFTREDTTSLPEIMGPSRYPDIDFLQIHPNGVAKLLKDLNPHKAAGPDNVAPTILKECAKELSLPLSLLFQASLKQGSVPSDWKSAMITPLFKKGDRSKASNYRPVSLTSICSKIMEHILHSHIMKHFDQHHILHDSQLGFCKRRSCESQLILTVQDLA